MTPLEVIRQAQADTLIDEDGQVVTLELLPGLSQAELRNFARKVPCPIPQEIEKLLSACRGFYGTIEQVDFSGIDLGFAFEAVFPFGLAIAADGFGNFWVVDLHPHSKNWGPIYFACHDAPVILYQADTVEEFLSELFRMCKPPHESLVDDVHEDRLARVWQTNPGVLSYEQCLQSEDPFSQPSHASLMTASRSLTYGRRRLGMAFRGAAMVPIQWSSAMVRMPCSPIRSRGV